MNIFYSGKFYKGEFETKSGIFTEVHIAGEEEACDPDYVIPGLIDIHTHGRVGEDFSFVDEEKIKKLLLSYAQCGVTGVLATTMTNDPVKVADSVSACGNIIKMQENGNPQKRNRENVNPENMRGMARLLGIHMEGPFLGKDKKGAHDEKYLRNFDYAWQDEMINRSGNHVKIISVDPTLFGSLEFIKRYTGNNITLSLAHSGAAYDDAVKAAGAGANHVTHLFNAMNPLNHREPGIIGAAFDCGMYSEIICDFIHVSKTVIKMWFTLCPDKMIIISDSMRAAGLPDGEYSIGGLPVIVKDKKATLYDGTIAGSTADVFSEMKNVIGAGVSREKAILAATQNPALSIGENKIGRIEKGCAADYIIIDKNFNIKQIYIRGEEI